MSLQTVGDIILQVVSENSSSERRITPSWTIGQLKAKLEPVTGIPPLSQKITLRGVGGDVAIQALDEENTQLVHFPLAPYAELHVSLRSSIILLHDCEDLVNDPTAFSLQCFSGGETLSPPLRRLFCHVSF